jgi:hypothetical protein
MTTTLVCYYDFSHHNYHTIVTTTTTLVVEYDFSHHNYHTIVTMTTTLVVEYDFSHLFHTHFMVTKAILNN